MKTLRYCSIGYWLLLIATTGCQHEEVLPACQGACTTIKGRLITGQPQSGIAGATVTAKWLAPTSFGARAVTKARTTTDADGNYSISFFIEDSELNNGYFSVFYAVDKNQYYTIGEPEDASFKLKRDTVFTNSAFLIPRKAYVRLAITNPTQLPATYAQGEFITDFNNCYGHNTTFNRAIKGGGAVVFWNSLPSENPMPIAGDQSILVAHYKTKNGLLTYTTDSLFIPAGTTRNYTVTY